MSRLVVRQVLEKWHDREVNPGSGYADLVIPISGPKGEGTLYVEAEKARGQWYFTTLEVTVAGTNDSYDLLAGP